MFSPGTLVKDKKTGAIGIILPRHSQIHDEGTIPVQFAGRTPTELDSAEDLEEMGRYSPGLDFEKCGAGLGEKCCIFFSMAGGAPACQKATGLHWDLVMRTMTAKRYPYELHPECQLK